MDIDASLRQALGQGFSGRLVETKDMNDVPAWEVQRRPDAKLYVQHEPPEPVVRCFYSIADGIQDGPEAVAMANHLSSGWYFANFHARQRPTEKWQLLMEYELDGRFLAAPNGPALFVEIVNYLLGVVASAHPMVISKLGGSTLADSF